MWRWYEKKILITFILMTNLMLMYIVSSYLFYTEWIESPYTFKNLFWNSNDSKKLRGKDLKTLFWYFQLSLKIVWFTIISHDLQHLLVAKINSWFLEMIFSGKYVNVIFLLQENVQKSFKSCTKYYQKRFFLKKNIFKEYVFTVN